MGREGILRGRSWLRDSHIEFLKVGCENVQRSRLLVRWFIFSFTLGTAAFLMVRERKRIEMNAQRGDSLPVGSLFPSQWEGVSWIGCSGVRCGLNRNGTNWANVWLADFLTPGYQSAYICSFSLYCGQSLM